VSARLRLVLVVAAAGLLAGPWVRGAGAQGSGGTSALPFFLEPPDAARSALGGMQCARDGDVAALFSNPAGTTGLAAEGLLSHAELAQGLRLESAAVALPAGRSGGTVSLGMSFAHLASMEGRDENGDPTGTSVGYGASLVRLGYARRLAAAVSAGLALEYLYQGIDGVGGSTFAVGLGVLVHTPAADFSAAADHLGPDLKADGSSAPAPRTVRLGVRARARPGLDLLAEVSRTGTYQPLGAAGLECRPTPALALRAGYRRELGGDTPLAGFSAGLGVGAGRWNADYALSQDQGQGVVHRFSLRIGLGLPRPAP